jgi:AraC family L-rhamnose operon transcriptional activator RhaR
LSDVTVTEKQTRYHARTTFPSARLPLLVSPHTLNGDHVPHDHDFWEAILILGGSGKHVSAQGHQTVGAGDAFLLRPGTWHTYADCDHLKVYNCCFGVSLLKRELAAFFAEPTINYLLLAGPTAAQSRGMMGFRLSREDQSHCRSLLDSMRESGLEDTPFADRECMAVLVLFLTRLARIAAADVVSAHRAHAPAPIHPAASRMMHLMEERIADSWSIQELAEAVHLEGAYCIRVFKQATGLSPIAYLSRCRAERAATLLLRSDLPIAEIALQIGWADQNYFARRFRAHFGISATEYRARFSPTRYGFGGDAEAKISEAPRLIRSS